MVATEEIVHDRIGSCQVIRPRDRTAPSHPDGTNPRTGPLDPAAGSWFYKVAERDAGWLPAQWRNGRPTAAPCHAVAENDFTVKASGDLLPQSLSGPLGAPPLPPYVLPRPAPKPHAPASHCPGAILCLPRLRIRRPAGSGPRTFCRCKSRRRHSRRIEPRQRVEIASACR